MRNSHTQGRKFVCHATILNREESKPLVFLSLQTSFFWVLLLLIRMDEGQDLSWKLLRLLIYCYM